MIAARDAISALPQLIVYQSGLDSQRDLDSSQKASHHYVFNAARNARTLLRRRILILAGAAARRGEYKYARGSYELMHPKPGCLLAGTGGMRTTISPAKRRIDRRSLPPGPDRTGNPSP